MRCVTVFATSAISMVCALVFRNTPPGVGAASLSEFAGAARQVEGITEPVSIHDGIRRGKGGTGGKVHARCSLRGGGDLTTTGTSAVDVTVFARGAIFVRVTLHRG